MKQKTTRQKIEELFKVSIGRSSYSDYFAMLNTAGKITAKSTLDIIIILLEATDKTESSD